MGVSLSYETTGPVSPAVRKAIEADAVQLNKGREWWGESLIFYRDRKRPKLLTGDTKVYAGGVEDDDLFDEDGEPTVGAASEDDAFMGPYEARFIILTLARWSKEHGVGWLVEMAGVELCRVADGVIDPPHVMGCDAPPAKARRDDRKAAQALTRRRGT